jgi:hypothetical protein
MTEQGLICRHCGRPIAVPISTCPWPGCGKTIMVICSECNANTDDQGETCQACGKVLVPHTLQLKKAPTKLPTALVELADKGGREVILPSAIVALYPDGFFYDGQRHRSILVDLFGAPLTPGRQAEALLFVATAYLVQGGYGILHPTGPADRGFLWDEVKPWDAQHRSLEARLALTARLGSSVAEAMQRAVAETIDFQLEIRLKTDGGRRVGLSQAGIEALPRVRAMLDTQRTAFKPLAMLQGGSVETKDRVRASWTKPAPAGIIELGRLTRLPAYEESVACRNVYQKLLGFVREDRDRAEGLAYEVGRVMRWFERLEMDPTLVMHDL